MTSQHKTCTKCGESKVLDEFCRDRGSKGGRRARCKPCVNEYIRRYYEENRDKVAEKAEYARSYYEENRETVNSINRKGHSERQELSQSLATVKPRTPWIPGEDALLLADNGMTVYQKSIELGRSYGSCRNRMGRLRAAKSA